MKILVTGGAGFIGSSLVDHLIALNYEVTVVDNLSTGVLENVNKQAAFVEMDILNKDLGNVFEKYKPDFVFHLAAQSDVQLSIQKPSTDASINILGTIHLLECCIAHKVKKIIYSSSAAVYGEPRYLGIDENHPINPISFYGQSKYTPEFYFKMFHDLYHLPYTILRYANVYGPRQLSKGEGGVIARFTSKICNEEPLIIFGDGKQTRDFVFVHDVVRANVMCLQNGDGQIYNIGTGHPMSINELVGMYELLMKKKIAIERNEAKKGDIQHSYYKIEKAKKELHWKPRTSLIEGIAMILHSKNIM